MKAFLILFVLFGLSLNGQTWADAENGNGTVPAFTYPIAKRIFPACATEDSDWCFWDADRQGNHIGESFLTVNSVTVVFD